MPLLPSINLPLPILIHAAGLCTLGLHFTFSDLVLVPAQKESDSPPQHHTTVLGIASLGLGLAYLSTSYMPIHENQFLYASVPVRMILAGIAGTRLIADAFCTEPHGRTSKMVSRLWGIMLYDGLGGFLLGWWLGSWGGKVPAYQ
jgi:hypothetical protein